MRWIGMRHRHVQYYKYNEVIEQFGGMYRESAGNKERMNAIVGVNRLTVRDYDAEEGM